MPFAEKAQFFGNSRSRLFTIHTCEAGADLVPDAIMRTSVGGTGQCETVRIGETAGKRRSAAKLLTRDEARRIAVNIAKLPELVRQTRA